MGHIVCFEVGRSTQTQSSATALRCSRKWMSGHAEALAQSVTDPNRRIKATVVPSAGASQETLPINTGRGVFSLDKSLSWMSPFPFRGAQ
jgi:nitroimidazol reductase NimA-like FMN-containing flavoprotein (pyridoxamine 5'-phosphate oxidase superfamily)